MKLYDKLMQMKGGRKMSDMEKQANLDVLKDLKSRAQAAMSSKLGGLNKVSVVAPNKEKLAKGLEVAQNVMEDMPESSDGDSLMPETKEEMSPDSEMQEDMPSDDNDTIVDDEMLASLPVDKIDELLMKLQALKAEKCKTE